MGVINHTAGIGLMASGALAGVFAAHTAAPQTFDFLAQGQLYPLQSVDLLSSITFKLAAMDPLFLGIAAAGLLYIGRSVMTSDHHPEPH